MDGAERLTNSSKKRKIKNRTLRLVLIALSVALIAVGAFIKIPLGIGLVPISLQCAFAILCGLLLGARDSFFAVLIYLIMGLIGIPIFTAGGGFGYVFQPTFGYLLGYLFAIPIGALIARGVKNTSRPKLWRCLLGAFCALVIVYTFGVIYMYLMLNFYMGKAMEMSRAWLTGCAVFLPTDTCFCIIAALAAHRIVPLVFRSSEGMYKLSAGLCTEEYVRNPKGEREFPEN